MYEFVRGPMVWISLAVCIVGLTIQIARIRMATKKKDKSGYFPKDEKAGFSERLNKIFKTPFIASTYRNLYLSIADTILGTQPAIAIVSLFFHVLLIVTPIFLMGHNILLFDSWGFSIFSLPEQVTDILTIIFMVCALAFLLRRIFISKVRAVSNLLDYVLLVITFMPFLTGFVAYHQLMDYETIITVHIISGELMLMAMGLTKLGHMIFFFFVRFKVGSEYSFQGGSRRW